MLDTRQRAGLSANISQLRAREHLDFINNVASLLGSPEESRCYRELLIKAAFQSDKNSLAEALMKMSAYG